MNKLTYVLWAFVSTVLNDFVLTKPDAPLTFRRGRDEFRLIHCDDARPGWATYQTPDGAKETTQLADGEVGQPVTGWGNSSGLRIELPAEMPGDTPYAQERVAATGAGGYNQPGS